MAVQLGIFSPKKKIKGAIMLFLFIVLTYSVAMLIITLQMEGNNDRVLQKLDLHELHEASHLDQASVATHEEQPATKPTIKVTPTVDPEEDFFRSKKLIPKIDLEGQCDNDTRTVILIASVPKHTSMRDAIRNSWGHLSERQKQHTRFFFVTGWTWSPKRNEATLAESWQLGDLLVGGFIYAVQIKTTYPMLMGVRWVLKNCPNVEYFFFGLETLVLNKDKLLQTIEENERQGSFSSPTMLGKLVHSSKVMRNPKSIYFVSLDAFPGERFPPFCTDENGYIFTKSVALGLLIDARIRPYIAIGDVYLGVVANDRGWNVIEEDLLTRREFSVENICTFYTLITMRTTEHLLIQTWNKTRSKTRKDCMGPSDSDNMLQGDVDNRNLFQEVLAYKLNHPHVCYNDEGDPVDIFIIALICSQPDHVEVRKAIRETWCKKTQIGGQNIRCLFLLAQAEGSTEAFNAQLRKEDVKYGDIIQVSFVDSLQNFILKFVLSLKWIIENCQHAKYFFRGDEDMFVNFDNVVSYLMDLRNNAEGMEKFWVGSRADPLEPEHKRMKSFQVAGEKSSEESYKSDGGYVYSTDTISEMYKLTFTISLTNAADGPFQGYLAKQLGFSLTGHEGFVTWTPQTDGCVLEESLVVHGNDRTATAIHSLWKNFTNPPLTCT